MKNPSSLVALAPWLAAAALAAACVAAHAQAAAGTATMQTQVSPGAASAVETRTITATVVEVDEAARNVTLKAQDGRMVTLNVGPEGRNFDQIKVGDKLTVQYTVGLSLELHKTSGAVRNSSETESMTRSAKGEKPGGSIGRQTRVLAEVMAVDHKKKLVTLRGPRGDKVDLAIEDPEQLKNIKKGDHVEAVYTEAVVVSMEAPKK